MNCKTSFCCGVVMRISRKLFGIFVGCCFFANLGAAIMDSKDQSHKLACAASSSSQSIENFREKIASDQVASFTHWDVYLDIKQYYLGRVFVLAKRLGAASFTDLYDDELLELHKIIKIIKNSYDCTQELRPDLINYAFLSNGMRHCHCHVVPRYKTERIFKGTVFKDENFGHNYSRQNTKKFRIDAVIHNEIRELVKRAIKDHYIIPMGVIS